MHNIRSIEFTTVTTLKRVFNGSSTFAPLRSCHCRPSLPCSCPAALCPANTSSPLSTPGPSNPHSTFCVPRLHGSGQLRGAGSQHLSFCVWLISLSYWFFIPSLRSGDNDTFFDSLRIVTGRPKWAMNVKMFRKWQTLIPRRV